MNPQSDRDLERLLGLRKLSELTKQFSEPQGKSQINQSTCLKVIDYLNSDHHIDTVALADLKDRCRKQLAEASAISNRANDAIRSYLIGAASALDLFPKTRVNVDDQDAHVLFTDWVIAISDFSSVTVAVATILKEIEAIKRSVKARGNGGRAGSEGSEQLERTDASE